MSPRPHGARVVVVALLAILIGVLFVLVPSGTLEAQNFRRGDCNGDTSIDIGDAITVLGILFSSGVPPGCEDACDANDDGSGDIADAISLLAALFGSPAVLLPPPFPGCGSDPTGDALGCAVSPCPPSAIHVAPPPTGNNANSGGPGDPVASLNAALALLVGSPSIDEIRMRSGTYASSSDLLLPGGITIRGGYDAAWNETGVVGPAGTVISMLGGTNPRVRIENVSGLVLEDLRIQAGGLPFGLGQNSNPVLVRNSTVDFIACEIQALAGSSGQSGSTGSAGFPGGAGGNGATGCSNCSSGGGGGTAGSGPVGSQGGTGGLGGFDWGPGATGGSGGGPLGGAGGSGALSDNCFGDGHNGQNGTSGGPGLAGSGGSSPGGTPGTVVSGTWVFLTNPGNAGSAGANGSGGGGGGGGGGGEETFLVCDPDRGGGGGGGGAGGTGGQPGTGGSGGGNSICILVLGSTVVIDGCNLIAGNGASGGTGGNGGPGGNGGLGGNGGAGPDDGGDGGDGGNGGTGGAGGGGGGGRGGSSVCVVRNGASTVAMSGTTTTLGAAGAGGLGGTGPTGNNGSAGATGVSTATLVIP